MPKVKRPAGSAYSITLRAAAAEASRAASARALDGALSRAPAGGGKAARRARLDASTSARAEIAAAAAPPARLTAFSSLLGALDEIAAAPAPPLKRAPQPEKNKAALAAALAFIEGARAPNPFASLTARLGRVRET